MRRPPARLLPEADDHHLVDDPADDHPTDHGGTTIDHRPADERSADHAAAELDRLAYHDHDPGDVVNGRYHVHDDLPPHVHYRDPDYVVAEYHHRHGSTTVALPGPHRSADHAAGDAPDHR